MRYDIPVLVRRAESADAHAIAVVHVRGWQAAYQGSVPQEYLDRLSPDERLPLWERRLAETSWPRRGILVAERAGDIVGFAGLGPTRDRDAAPATIGELLALYLVPELWGAGAGRRLMASAVRTLTLAGYEQATLWVLDTNTRARRFYRAAGWYPDGTVVRDESRGFPLTEVRYRRTLGPGDPAPAC